MGKKNLKSQLQNYVKEIDPKDELCNSCKVKGACCYGATEKDGTVYGLKSAKCRYLKDDGCCGVYKDRFKKNPKCLDTASAIMHRALPNECEYVKKLEGYKGKVIADKDTEKGLLKRVVKSLTGEETYYTDELLELVRRYKVK